MESVQTTLARPSLPTNETRVTASFITNNLSTNDLRIVAEDLITAWIEAVETRDPAEMRLAEMRNVLQLAYTRAEVSTTLRESIRTSPLSSGVEMDIAPVRERMGQTAESGRTSTEIEQMENNLASQHTGRFVAFWQGREVDSGPDLAALVRRFYAEHKDVPVYIARMSETGYSADLSPEILHFSFQQGILAYLQRALDLIAQCFSAIQEVQVQSEQDPDTGEDWLVLDITVHNEINEVLTQYDTYTSRWIAAVPWPERSKIRLSYNIV
jgi:hypothetical protein